MGAAGESGRAILSRLQHGTADFVRSLRSTGVKVLKLAAVKTSDQLFAAVAELPKLKSLHLVNVPITLAEERQSLFPSGGPSQLTQLTVQGGNCSTENLEFLVGCRDLEHVEIQLESQADDRVLKWLSECPNVKSVKLKNTNVTNAGFEALQKNVSLVSLEIDNSGIDDNGLETVAGLDSLQKLHLTNSHVSSKGIAESQFPAGLEHISIEPALVRTADLIAMPEHVRQILSKSAADADGGVVVWDTQSGKVVMAGAERYAGHQISVVADGSIIVAGGDHLAFFDAESGQLIRVFSPARQQVNCLTVSPDGEQVAVASDDVLEIQDTRSSRIVQKIERSFRAALAVFSNDGRYLVESSRDYESVVYDLREHGRIIQELKGIPVGFSADRQFLAVRHPRGYVYQIGNSSPVYSTAMAFAQFMGDGVLLADSGKGNLAFHSVKENRVIRELKLPRSEVGRFWCADNAKKQLARIEGQTLRLFSLDDGSPVSELAMDNWGRVTFAGIDFVGSKRLAGSVVRDRFRESP